MSDPGSLQGVAYPIPGVLYWDASAADEYIRAGAWFNGTVGQALSATAQRVPDKHAWVSDERKVTFAEVDELTDRLGAALLDMGLAPGDRAIFQMGTTIETVIALLACYKIGIVPVCAVPQYREVEIGQLTTLSGARAYFIQADFNSFDLIGFAQQMLQQYPTLQFLIAARAGHRTGMQSLEDLIERTSISHARARLSQIRPGARDVLSFQLSGGTTGVPKIIPRFHAEYLGHSTHWMRQFGITPSSTLIWSLPLVHNAGQLYALVPPIVMGLTVVLMPRVDIARMLELIGEHRVTHALSIGPVAPQLIACQEIRDHDLSSLHLFATMSRAEGTESHIGVPCANFYGITEGIVLANAATAPPFARHHTQGASGCELDQIRLLRPESEEPVSFGEMGEFCFKGPSTLRAYFGAPEATAAAFTADGFYRSGDMMTAHVMDGRIHYTFEGRLRDNVNRGGEKIGCEEVEAFVSQYPAVADAKLVAMPDPVYQEKGCVFVILRPGHAAPDVKQLAGFLVGHGLAKFKCPERIEVVDAFPVTRVGKVDKAALRAQITEKVRRELSSTAPPASAALGVAR